MPNDNHEQYDGNNICTYTDLITIGNTLTTEQVDACILAAGEAPADSPKKIYLDNKASQPAPNSFSPFYFSDPALWYSEEELIDAKGTWYNYLHTVYASTQQNALATQLKVDNYRNFVTITEYTETINSTPHKYYGLIITTKYGDNNDPASTWTNSILKPMYVLAEEDARTGIFLDEIMCKQEYNFTNSWGNMCTDLGFIQGRRNLKDNESGDIIPYGIWQSGLAPEAYHIEGGHQYGNSYDHHLQWQNNPSTFYTASVYNKIDDLLFIVAIGGLKFEYNNTVYKPIVENGVVVGYTDDMTQISEWDEWEDIGDHVIPVTPPTPPTPSGDEYSNMGLGVGTNVGGLTNYAIMSIADLATLLADFNEHLETGMSIQNNFVCLYKLGPLSSFLCNTTTRAIIMSANAEQNFVSVDDYAVVTGQKSEHHFGSYDVPRFTNTFYDFSPYSTYELFIPCCGWVPLPDTVAGRTIDVYLIFDLASCTCKGIVRISGTTIAEISGVLGSSVPFYMIEHGMERLAQVTAITQTLSSLAVGGVGAASGNVGVAAYGLSQLTQSLNDLNVAGNTNFTAIKGGNGDITAVGNGEYCTIKVTHPVVDSVVNNSMFGHSVGYLCNTIGKLNTFTGFTVCGNPHVTFSASAEEREEIERLLSMGVIL